MAHFRLKTDRPGEYRWSLHADNGQIIAVSGEGYKNRADCEHAIQLVKRLAPTATITDQTSNQAAPIPPWK